MANVEVTIGGDAKAFKKACKEAEGAAATTKQKVEKDLAGGLGKLGSRVGMGGVGGYASSKTAAALAAVGTAAAVARKAIELYSEEQERAAQELERSAAAAADYSASETARANAIMQATTAIQSLVSSEQVSNENKERAIQLVEKLKRRYGELTIEVDKNGRVTEKSLLAAQRAELERRARAIRGEMQENTAAAAMYRGMSHGALNIASNWLQQEKLVGYAEKANTYSDRNRKLANDLKEINAQLADLQAAPEAKKRLEAAKQADKAEAERVANDAEYVKAEQAANRELARIQAERARMEERTIEQQRARYVAEKVNAVNGGNLNPTDRAALESAYGNLFDETQAANLRKQGEELRKNLQIRQLELKGDAKGADLLRRLNAEEEKRGRTLTEQERALVTLGHETDWNLRSEELRQNRIALGRPEIANPYQTDALIQMGERVNVASTINYPMKTYNEVDIIRQTLEKIPALLEREKAVFP